MKSVIVIIYFCLSGSIIFSQPSIIQWERAFGGTLHDKGFKIIQKSNGEFLICGETSSSDYDAFDNHGYSYDLWFINLNDTGGLIRKKCFGGTREERGLKIDLNGNGISLYGTAESENGDLLGVHSMADGADLWLLKLDAFLNISFQKTIGSASADQALQIHEMHNGDYLFLGLTGQEGNDVDTAYGYDDLWVCRTDSNMNIDWQLTLGSTSYEYGGDIVETLDSGYLVVGGTLMNDGSITCQPFNGTIFITKLDSSGTVLWQKCFSSSYAKKVIATSDGGFVIAAITFDSTIVGYSGFSDYLLFKIDSLGNQQWAHCYGGSQFDEPNDLLQCSDGGYIIAGGSDSYDFYASSSHGAKDALLVKVDSLGNFQWSQCYGSWGDDICNSIIETSDGGLALTGSTSSWIGLPAYGMEDLWVLKLNYPGNGIFTPDNSIEQFRTYASAEGMGIELTSKKVQEVTISIYDISGRKLFSDNAHVEIGRNKLDYNLGYSNGVFLIELRTKDGKVVNKLVK